MTLPQTHKWCLVNSKKASGGVCMYDEGKPAEIGDFAQQIENCYADPEKILAR